MARNFALVGVIELGTMGAGIVEVFARNGIEVVAVESSQAGVDKGRLPVASAVTGAGARESAVSLDIAGGGLQAPKPQPKRWPPKPPDAEPAPPRPRESA